MKHSISLACALTALACGDALAQDAAPQAETPQTGLPSDAARAATEIQAGQMTGPESRTGLGGHGLVFLADGDTKTVSLQATRTWQGTNNRVLETYSLTGKVFTDVTDEDDDSGFFVTDVGRVRGTGFETSLTRSWSSNLRRPATPAQIITAVGLARDRCSKRIGVDPSLTPSFCETAHLGDLIEQLPESDRADILFQDTWVNSTVSSFGMTFGGASKTFKFRDPTTLASDDTDEINWTVGLHGGQSRQLPGLGRVYYGGGVSYRSEYSAADTRTLCPAPPPSGPQECFPAAYGPPQEEEGTTVFLVARNQDTWAPWGIPVVLQIKPAYEFESERFGVETSLYMFAGKGGLRGGLRLSLQTDDNDDKTDDENARFGIFVGSAF